MKKITIMVLVLALILSTNMMVFADTSFEVIESRIGITLNGEIQEWDFDDLGLTRNTNVGRVIVPVRAISELMGYTVDWEGTTQTVTITKGDSKVDFVIGSNVVKTDKGEIEMELPATIIDGRTYLPVRFVAVALGVEVNWVSHKHVQGANDYQNDFYVTLNTDVVEEVVDSNDVDFTENAILDLVVEEYPAMAKIHNSNTFVFSSVPTDVKNGYLVFTNMSAINQFAVDVQGWGNVGVDSTLLNMLKVATGNSQDAQVIYDEWIHCLNNNGSTKAEDTWTQAGGSQFMITNEGVHAGVRILVRQ